LVDGTRSVAELARDFAALPAAQGRDPQNPNPDEVTQRLAKLARLALLEA
jgi:hypothetical protein